MTTSHLTNPAKDAGQVIGYSHSTRLPKNVSQVAGYKSPKYGDISRWLSPTYELFTFEMEME